MWMVTVDELHFDDPVEVIGQGSFGVVLLAEYRGTKVAIKRAIRNNIKRHGQSARGSIQAKKTPGSIQVKKKSRGLGVGKATDVSVDSVESYDLQSCDGSEESPPSTVDLETGKTNSSAGPGSKGLSMGQCSIGFLQEDFGGDSKWAWLFPWLKKSDYQTRFKQSILGNSSYGTVQKSALAKACPWFDEQAKREEEFMSEMRILSRLRHPCITTVMGAVIARNHDPMLVMEYMEYGSLHDLLRNETMYLSG